MVIPDQQQALARGRVSRPLSLAAEITATGRNPDFLDHPDLMNGKDTYKLTVPADTPAKDFWSVIVYSAKTKGFVEGVDRVGLSSLEVPKMKKNADGSVDVYFAPQAPEGLESNWIPTGEDFFLLFRLYGPSEALFNKTWTLPDVEKVR